MKIARNFLKIPQYNFSKVLGIYALAAIPMGILGWIIAPMLASEPGKPGLERLAVLTVGLMWQFLLVIVIIYREAGDLRIPTIRERLWLKTPRTNKNDEGRPSLWLILIPLLLLTAVYELGISGIIRDFWTSVIPSFTEPSGFALDSIFDTPEGRTQMVGNWGLLLLFVVNAVFNTVIGEELLFRGLLLPRMNGLFGKWDWVANGILFGLYHLHQPWSILSSAVSGCLFFALPTKRFYSSWLGIIAHSGQSIFFTFLLLGLVLGLS
jgi:membrane protease YdiL (CAAX protease family)